MEKEKKEINPSIQEFHKGKIDSQVYQEKDVHSTNKRSKKKGREGKKGPRPTVWVGRLLRSQEKKKRYYPGRVFIDAEKGQLIPPSSRGVEDCVPEERGENLEGSGGTAEGNSGSWKNSDGKGGNNVTGVSGRTSHFWGGGSQTIVESGERGASG